MLSPIGFTSAYAPTPRPEPVLRTGFTGESSPGMRPPRSARAARGIHAHLTTDDWAIVSAAVGYACGPDETGSIHAAHPVLATSIACDRDFGRLTGPVTVGYLKSDMVGGQEADLYNQLTNAVNWLESGRPDDYCSSWADFRARRVDAVAR